VGRDVVFDAGQFSPATSAGRRLLAHELTHVVQQGSDGSSPMLKDGLEIGRPDDDAEREAGSVASGFQTSEPFIVRHHMRAAVQREFTSDDAKNLGIGAAIVGGAVAVGFGIAALAGAFSSKKKPVPGQKGDAKSVEGAIQALEGVAGKYQADLGVKSVRLDEAQLEQQLAAWRGTVEKSEEIIEALPGKDPALKQRLKSAYQRAIQAAVEFAADRLGQTKHSVYEKYRDLITEWALPQAQPKATGDELSQALPEAERKQLTVITGSVTFGLDELFSTEGVRTTIPLPRGATARFSSQILPELQDGLRSVAGTIIPKPLELNSTMTLALDLEPHGGQYSAYRFTYVEHKPKKGRATQEVLIEDLGAIGVEGSTKTRMESPQAKFKVHGFKRASGWTDEQFTEVLTAIGRIPDAILSPVDGISFARARVKATDPKAGGDYNPDTHTITMYDIAFPVKSTRFGKPGDISDDTVRAVEHEVGHAVDLLPLRKALTNLDSKGAAFKAAFAQFEDPPGSNNYSFPNTEQANFNNLKAQITAAEGALTRTRSESGERYEKDASGKFEMVQGGTAAGSVEFRRAAGKDGGKRITEYSNKEWQEYYAESFSFYISDPGTLQRLRPNVFAFFKRTHPK
jgi:hypothetical protein